MDRKQYLYELAKQLKDLEQVEFDEALHYVEEYFEEAGIENEQKVIDELGSPAKYAAQLKAESTIKNTYVQDTQTPPKSNVKTLWLIILGIFALPIAGPLSIVAVAILFALLACLFAFIVAGGALILVGTILFIPLLISSFALFAFNFYSGLIAMGGTLLLLGLLILGICGYYYLCRQAIPACIRFTGKLFQSLKARIQKEKATC